MGQSPITLHAKAKYPIHLLQQKFSRTPLWPSASTCKGHCRRWPREPRQLACPHRPWRSTAWRGRVRLF